MSGSWWQAGIDRVRQWRHRTRSTTNVPKSTENSSGRRAFHPGMGAILLYHRVARLDRDVQLLAVSPDRFAKQVEIVRRLADPVRLDRWVRDARQGRPRTNAVAITFDDGYHDNVSEALPILEQNDVPATLFVATGMVGARKEFWWDELDRILLEPPRSAATIEILWEGSMRRWDLEPLPSAVGGDAAWKAWNVLMPPTTIRQQAYLELCECLRLLPNPLQEKTLEAVRRQASACEAPRESHRIVTEQELSKLEGSEILEIGAHTVNHPWLASLDDATQADEIQSSQRRLELIVGSVSGFSYPFGVPGAYDSKSVQIVRESGFSYATANFHSTIRCDADPFALPRLVVRDWEPEEFEERLSNWLSQSQTVASSAWFHESHNPEHQAA